MAKRVEVIENKEWEVGEVKEVVEVEEVEEVEEVKEVKELEEVKEDGGVAGREEAWAGRGASMGKGSREKMVCQYSYLYVLRSNGRGDRECAKIFGLLGSNRRGRREPLACDAPAWIHRFLGLFAFYSPR